MATFDRNRIAKKFKKSTNLVTLTPTFILVSLFNL